MQGAARRRDLHLNGAPIGAAALPPDESGPLHRVEMTGQHRTLDPDSASELELAAPPLALERVEDEPDRNRAAAFGKCGVEGAADTLSGRRE